MPKRYKIQAQAVAQVEIWVVADSRVDAIRRAKEADPTDWHEPTAPIDHACFIIVATEDAEGP